MTSVSFPPLSEEVKPLRPTAYTKIYIILRDCRGRGGTSFACRLRALSEMRPRSESCSFGWINRGACWCASSRSRTATPEMPSGITNTPSPLTKLEWPEMRMHWPMRSLWRRRVGRRSAVALWACSYKWMIIVWINFKNLKLYLSQIKCGVFLSCHNSHNSHSLYFKYE